MVLFIQASDINATRVQLDEITSKLKVKRSKLASLKKEEHKILKKLGRIKKNLRNSKNNLRYAKYRITKNESRLDQLEKSLSNEKQKLEVELNAFQGRIREIFKNRNLGYLEFFFSSTTLREFISQSYFFEKIILKDVEVIKALRIRNASIQKTKTQMSRKVSEIKKLSRKIAKEQKAIQKQVSQENEVYRYISKQRKTYEKEVAALLKTSKEIESLLRRQRGVRRNGTGSFSWPIAKDKYWVSSSYGHRRHPIFRVVRFHSGLDLAANRGVPVTASDSGEVISSGLWGGYGKAIIIDHGKKLSTVYAHLSHIYVKKGALVNKGDKIGLVGSSGYATGPHLHFEIRSDGKTLNPIYKLPKRW